MDCENRKSQRIPTASSSSPTRGQHWWFDEQRYNPDSPVSSSPTQQQLSSSPDPKVAIPLPAADGWNKWMRDSLKKSDLLEDFATPE